MKALKWIAIVLVILVLLVVGTIVIILNSSGLQKSIVLGQLEEQADHVELEYFKTNLFSTVTVRGLVLDKDGTLIELPSAEIEYSLSDLIFGSKLVVSKVVVDNVSVTLPAARPQVPMGTGPARLPNAATPHAPESQQKSTESRKAEPDAKEDKEPLPPFEGIFGKAESPIQLFIDGINVRATIIMTPQRQMTLTMSGGGIAPGKTSSIVTQVTLTDTSQDAAAASVKVDSTLQIAQTEDKRLNAITLDVTTYAEGGMLAQAATLEAKLKLYQETSGKEIYTFHLGDGSKQDLIVYDAHFDPAQKSLSGTMNAALNQKDLAAVITGKNIPDFSLEGNGTFNLNSETYAGNTILKATGQLAKLTQIDPKLAKLPTIHFSLDYDGSVTATSLTANKAKLEVKHSDGKALLSATLAQPITVGEDFDPASLDGSIAVINITDCALPWFSPMADGIDISSGTLNGQLTADASKGVVTITTQKPLTISALTVAQAGKTLVEQIQIQADFTAKLSQDTVNASIRGINITDAQKRKLVTVTAEASAALDDGQPQDMSISTNAHVYFLSLLEQPFAPQKLAERVDLILSLKAKQPDTKTLAVETFDITLTGKQNAELASAKLLKTLLLDITAPEKNTPEALIAGDMLRLNLVQLPRPILNAFLGDIQLTNGNVTAQLLVSGDGKEITVTSEKPIQATNLTVTQSGQPMLNSLNAKLSPRIVYSAQQTTVTLPDIALSSGPVSLLTGKADIVATPQGASPLQSANFDFKADLAQLLNQPVLAAMNNLAAGTATLSGKVTNPAKGNYQIQASLNDLRVVEPAGAIKLLTFKSQGELGLPGKLTFDAPLRLEGPLGTTQLKAIGSLDQSATPMRFDVKANGNDVFLDDLQLLAAAFKKPTAPGSTAVSQPTPGQSQPTQQPGTNKPKPVASKPGVAESRPPWADYAGQATLTIVKVHQGKYIISSIESAVTVDAQKVVLAPAKANFMGAPFDAKATVDHLPGKRPKAPYGLDATLSLTKFDVGKFLTLTKPGTTPPLTGLFTVSGGLNSTAISLETLADTAQGQFALNGGPGQLRALAGVGGGADTAAQGVNAALGIAGALLGNKVRELPALNQLITLLRQIDYDTLKIEAKRASDLNINLTTFLMQGPQVRLNGQGQVKHVQGTPIAEQPLNINVALDAKGQTANLMSELRMLTGKADKTGYLPGPKFAITGTPASPDFSQLNSIITKAAAGIISGGFGGKAQPDTEETKAKQDDQTKEAVKGLIQGLFGN